MINKYIKTNSYCDKEQMKKLEYYPIVYFILKRWTKDAKRRFLATWVPFALIVGAIAFHWFALNKEISLARN